MKQQPSIEAYFSKPKPGRSKRYVETDTRAVRFIAQAAIDVELFTIPLYMTSMYSIAGSHQITGNNDFYKGRRWPGMATRVIPDGTPLRERANQQAFNTIFSVFIQEMLHLQMAANLATAIGVKPTFTSPDLQKEFGWICYGKGKTVIPHIVDLTDTEKFANVEVNIGPLNHNAIRLFLAIEEPTEKAVIVKNRDRYFPEIPFPDGTDLSTVMFGSIGWMYHCYDAYLSIEYDDGTTLWDAVFNQNGQQNDLFNNFSFPGHPMREFMGFESTIALTDKTIARQQARNMMMAITDQGEGSVKVSRPKLEAVEKVKERYRADADALTSDYPRYDDTGKQMAQSPDGYARRSNDGDDHYECFLRVQKLLDEKLITTWDMTGKAGRWEPGDFTTADYNPDSNPYDLPQPAQIANALNQLHEQAETMFPLLSRAVVGAIKGVTTVLDQYWNPATPGNTVGFPFPSMSGTADRMATCWAVFGRTPDLSLGVGKPTGGLSHACQALSTYGPDEFKGTNSCAEVAVYHTCRGSNQCKGMGGCGFAQLKTGGGGCNTRAVGPAAAKANIGHPAGYNCSAVVMRTRGGRLRKDEGAESADHYTAPNANMCAGFGGCAVPISACQLYPIDGTMDVYKLTPHGCGGEFIGNIKFKVGDKVQDIAYQAYAMWAENLKYPKPEKPAPNALRVAFPPST